MSENTGKLTLIKKDRLEELNSQVKFFEVRPGVKLAYREYGDSQGHPFLFFHGSGAHVHPMPLDEPAKELGFRMIVPDRPGIGDSDFRKWTHLDFAEDMKKLADHLGLNKFGIMGISGGGPTLMATALAIPERLECVIALACAAPLYGDPKWQKQIGTADRLFAKLARKLPLALFKVPYGIIGVTQKCIKSPATFAKMFDSSLCEEDKKLFKDPDFQYLFMRDFQELFKQSLTPPAYDAQRIICDWGFELRDIEVHVDFFQGDADLFVPIKFSSYYEQELKDVTMHIIPGQGHFYHIAYGYSTLEKIKEMYYA